MSSSPNKRVYLVDSSIYIFRAWHVYDDSITDSDGNPANAVFGFSEFLRQLLESEQPEYIACAFDDRQTDSYRKEIYPEYKANRPRPPEELIRQFGYCREFVRAVGIADFASNRYEADDIIGTLARQFRDKGFAITIVSADKDLAQLLVNKSDFLWDFARKRLLDHKGIEKHFGVKPQQIADMLALAGDSVDNIPGIPGVGYKMASNLLSKYSTIDDILENIENISKMKFRGSKRVQSLVEEHQGILSMTKKLTTIVTDAKFNGPKNDLGWHGVDHSMLSDLFDRLDAGASRRQYWLSHQSA